MYNLVLIWFIYKFSSVFIIFTWSLGRFFSLKNLLKLNRLLWRGDCTLMLLELFDFSGEFGLFVFRFLFLFVIFVINKRYMFNFKLEIIKNLILYKWDWNDDY